MSFIMKKAVRSAKKLRIGFSGPSNFGKTYSALLLAYGLCGDWSKIAVIDTERDSASLYAHLGDYNVIPFGPPYRPGRYIEAIGFAESQGMEVIIIDSTSHEWIGEGGCLDWITELTEQSTSANSFKQWGIVTPEHNKFIDRILNSSCHILTTTRKKQTHAMVTGDNGKLTVQKLGLEDVQRDGWEYELDLNFTFQNALHYVKATKDRTQLFKSQNDFIITEETGKILKEWSEQGLSLIDDALNQIRRVETLDQLAAVLNSYPTLKQNEDFREALKARRDVILSFQKNQVQFKTGLDSVVIPTTPPVESTPEPEVAQTSTTNETTQVVQNETSDQEFISPLPADVTSNITPL